MQFDKVEAAGPAAPPVCARCQRPLDEYFELGGHMFCRPCVDGFRGGAGSFWRAALWGTGAAVLGTLVWLAILALLNWELGIIAIAVGLLVGIAVRKGSRGLGGWKYQALAMALTYVSITASYVPFVIKGLSEVAPKKAASSERSASEKSARPAPGAHEQGATGQAPADATSDEGAQDEAAAPKKPVSGGAVVLGFMVVFALALAWPFILGTSNIIGWIIIGIALYEAWKINRRVPISGPFRFSGALAVPAPAPVTPGMPPPAAEP